MRDDQFQTDDSPGECTTTESFADHDIEDGSTLIQRSYYRLAGAGRTEFEPTESFFDALESAFIWAYLGTTQETDIPDHVEAAIDDARARTAAEFAGTAAEFVDRPDADLRTDVIPAFYRHLAEFHCTYR
jgi:hypothetical protein